MAARASDLPSQRRRHRHDGHASARAGSRRIEELSREFPDHYWYPTSDLHVTVLGIRKEADPQALADVLRNEAPITASIRGLALSPDTVYAQVYVDRGRLASLRRRIAKAYGVPLRRVGIDLAHANIARLRTSDVDELRRRVRTRRRQNFGPATFTKVLLARTDKVFTAAHTTVCAEFPLT
ncbi:MAG: 2'-5' RNA ligase family protein [Actinomycetes bacterium]